MNIQTKEHFFILDKILLIHIDSYMQFPFFFFTINILNKGIRCFEALCNGDGAKFNLSNRCEENCQSYIREFGGSTSSFSLYT